MQKSKWRHSKSYETMFFENSLELQKTNMHNFGTDFAYCHFRGLVEIIFLCCDSNRKCSEFIFYQLNFKNIFFQITINDLEGEMIEI
jgi:hypothetical protein